MKNLLFIITSASMLFASCSSSARMGYTYFDDMYDDRPYYPERAQNTGQSNQNYQGANQYNNQSGEYYQDDENARTFEQDRYVGGEYTDRINRFNRSSGNFDYYSPYYTGYNNGFNSGFNMGVGIGMGGFGNSWMSPWYSSSFHFGWGRPSFGWGMNYGFSNWNRPFYDPFFDPFWGGGFGWNRPMGWGNPWNNIGWNNPWYYNSPVIINNFYGDRSPRNSYYGPRSNSVNNTYYNRGINRTVSPSGINNTNTIRTNSGIQMQRTERPNLNTPTQNNTGTPGRTGDRPAIGVTPGRTNPNTSNPNMPSRGNNTVSPSPNATPGRGSNVAPSQNATPRYRYSEPNSTPYTPREQSTPNRPSFNSPSRSNFPSSNPPSRNNTPRTNSPSYSPSQRSAPSTPSPRSAPSSTPSRSGGSTPSRAPR